MANQFVYVNGLHNVFDVSTNGKFDYSAPKSEVSVIADSSSIMFMTSNADDVGLGVASGENHIWADGRLFKGTDTNTWRELKVNGERKISSTSSAAIDISAGAGITVSYTNNKVVVAATSPLKIWQGTLAQYRALGSNIDPNTLYLTTNLNDDEEGSV